VHVKYLKYEEDKKLVWRLAKLRQEKSGTSWVSSQTKGLTC
jgi:hypothetical protein